MDVILDFGFWSRQERESFRAQARLLGARTEVRFLNVPKEVLRQRLAERNSNLPPHTFRVSLAQLEEWWDLFEPPNSSELAPD
jgi:predicted kinase